MTISYTAKAVIGRFYALRIAIYGALTSRMPFETTARRSACRILQSATRELENLER